jgi:hypothetical protein
VRAEAANALASYGLERAWPQLKAAFNRDRHWLLRCSVLAALAEQPSIPATWLLELATLAIEDTDGTVRVGDAEAHQARLLLQQLQQDPDHRVVATALNGLQA